MKNHPSTAASIYQATEKIKHSVRIKITLIDEVDGELLARCVERVRNRFPYYFVRLDLDPNDGIVISPNDLPVAVRQGFGVGELFSADVNYHMQYFRYEGKTVWFDYAHAFMDGEARVNYTRSIFYYYFSEKYGVALDPTNVKLADEPVPACETVDYCFVLANDDSIPLPAPPEPSAPPTTLRSLGLIDDEDRKQTYYEIVLPENAFVRYSKSVDSSPSTVPAVFLAKAIFELHDHLDAPLLGIVPINLREAVGCRGAMCSTVSAAMLSYTERVRDWSFERLSTVTRGMVMAQSYEDRLRSAVRAGAIAAVASATNPDVWEERRKATTGPNPLEFNTFVVSTPGRLGWEDMEPYVESVFSLTPLAGQEIVMETNLTRAGYQIAFMQPFENDVYLRKFLELLEREGIHYDISGPFPLIAPTAIPEFFAK